MCARQMEPAGIDDGMLSVMLVTSVEPLLVFRSLISDIAAPAVVVIDRRIRTINALTPALPTKWLTIRVL